MSQYNNKHIKVLQEEFLMHKVYRKKRQENEASI